MSGTHANSMRTETNSRTGPSRLDVLYDLKAQRPVNRDDAYSCLLKRVDTETMRHTACKLTMAVLEDEVSGTQCNDAGHFNGSQVQLGYIHACEINARKYLTKEMWSEQWDNAMFIWAHGFAYAALCGGLATTRPALEMNFQEYPHLLFERYPTHSLRRKALHGDEHSCAAFIRSRQPAAAGACAPWAAWGYPPVLPALRAEWAAAAAKVLPAREPPCDHVRKQHQNLAGQSAAYGAVYVRCGDFAAGVKAHPFIAPAWLDSFVPRVLRDVTHVVVLGNRAVHSSAAVAPLCDRYLEAIRARVAWLTNKTVVVAPELPGGSVLSIVRDTHCLSQSRVLISMAVGSSFAFWQHILHDGCASYMPYAVIGVKGAKNRTFNQGTFGRRQRVSQHFIAVRSHHLTTHTGLSQSYRATALSSVESPVRRLEVRY